MQRFPTNGIGLWVIAALILLLWLGSGLYVVGPGERGVVLLFREATEQTEPGLRYHLPWPVQSHEIVDIAQVRRAEVGFRTVAAETLSRDARGSARTVPLYQCRRSYHRTFRPPFTPSAKSTCSRSNANI